MEGVEVARGRAIQARQTMWHPLVDLGLAAVTCWLRLPWNRERFKTALAGTKLVNNCALTSGFVSREKNTALAINPSQPDVLKPTFRSAFRLRGSPTLVLPERKNRYVPKAVLQETQWTLNYLFTCRFVNKLNCTSWACHLVQSDALENPLWSCVRLKKLSALVLPKRIFFTRLFLQKPK